MAKLKLENGDTLYLKLEEWEDGVDIICSDTRKGLKGCSASFLASIDADGTLSPIAYLNDKIKARLKFDKWGAIKVSR